MFENRLGVSVRGEISERSNGADRKRFAYLAYDL